MADTQAEVVGVTATMAGATEDARGTHNEKLELHGADHPGMILASAPLTGEHVSGGVLHKTERVVGRICCAYAYTTVHLWGCTFGVSKAITEQALFNQLMQFLMGLTDEFDNVKNQLLVMDPVLTVNRAYAMVSRVERQKEVHMELEQIDNVAMNTKVGYRRDGMVKGGQRKKGYVDKHNNIVTTVRERKIAIEKKDTSEILLQELIKLVIGGLQPIGQEPLQANYAAQFDDFAGNDCAFVTHGDNVLNS
ncbi:UNVERIFIED_CONTAM: hypothetical protein Sradi_1867500 [Sesamum radiatum]|uniref:Uncharacterized protein n=1 Tax=Sesamum radiatum TaxID=300843 RepID=A0AAW2U118_SESRA